MTRKIFRVLYVDPPPTGSWQNPPSERYVVPAHGSYEFLTPRETHVRDAMFLITLLGPLVAAAFSLLATQKWYLPKKAFSYGVLSAAWFTTITIFGTLIFFQKGETGRLTFMLAIVHGLVQST